MHKEILSTAPIISDLDLQNLVETENLEEEEADEEFSLEDFFAETEQSEAIGDNTNKVETGGFLTSLIEETEKNRQSIIPKLNFGDIAKGLSFTGSFFNMLGNFGGTCGVVCAHTLAGAGSAIGNVGSSMPLAGLGPMSLGSNNPFGFNVDANGNYSLSGNIDELSKKTGLSKSDLLSGKYTADDIFLSFVHSITNGFCQVFCFGIVNTLVEGFI